MSSWKNSFSLLYQNIRTVILFELSYKLICLSILTPILFALFNLSLQLSGFRYLSADRLYKYLSAPSTLLLLLVIVFGITCITLFEMTALVQCFHASRLHQNISVIELYYASFFTLKKLFVKPDITLFIFILLIIPLTNIAVVSGYISALTIPRFVMSFIESHSSLLLGFWLGFFLLEFLALRWCLSIHCFTLEKSSFSDARKRSVFLLRTHYLRALFQIFFWNLCILVLLLALSIPVTVITLLIIKCMLPGNVSYSAALTAVNHILFWVFHIYALFHVPIVFARLSSMYYDNLEQCGEKPPALYHRLPRGIRRTTHNRLLCLVLLAALINLGYLGLYRYIGLPWNQNILSVPEISAHRGDSVNAPENTLPAFESAILKQADCAELDIQQTSDGVIVVMHDSNLKRVTGNNIDIWNITYTELSQLDAGSWFSASYRGTPIPTLDEVMQLCKGHIRLNIELKPTGHETDYVEEVVRIIQENDFTYDCVIASKSKEVLQRVKEIDSRIPTIYLMTVAYGDFSEMDYIDGISVESSFITRSMVNHVHDSGKVIYAWTINDESSMHRMLSLGVDSLITDNPVKAREIYYAESMNDSLVFLIREFMKIARKYIPTIY